MLVGNAHSMHYHTALMDIQFKVPIVNIHLTNISNKYKKKTKD